MNLNTMPTISRPHARLLRLLELIHQHGQVSRSELMHQTGYSAFLVSRMCDELIRAGLVCETGSGSSTGGRPPMLLAISTELGRLAGVHIGTVNARIAVTDIGGNLLGYRKIPSRAAEGPNVALPHLLTHVEACLAESGGTRERLRGIGIGISGVLDRESGTTLFWPKVPQWVDVGVKRVFVERFGTPVEIEDSPRTIALAERRFGAAGEADPFIYIMIGAGTGAALFLNGKLFTGAGGFAGEFGHVTIDENGPLCSCGNLGCLEALISASALIRRAQNAVAEGLAIQLWRLSQGNPNVISAETIAQAAAQNDRFCQNLLHGAGTHLGVGVVGLVNLFNPELVIIGGGLALAAGDFLLPAVESVVRHRALPRSSARVEIRLSTLQESDWARGAALLLTRNALESAFTERLAGAQVTT